VKVQIPSSDEEKDDGEWAVKDESNVDEADFGRDDGDKA
jgi:hypothetical protein